MIASPFLLGSLGEIVRAVVLSTAKLPHISFRHSLINEARLSCIDITHVYNHNLRRLIHFHSLHSLRADVFDESRWQFTIHRRLFFSFPTDLSASQNPSNSTVNRAALPFPVRNPWGKSGNGRKSRREAIKVLQTAFTLAVSLSVFFK